MKRRKSLKILALSSLTPQILLQKTNQVNAKNTNKGSLTFQTLINSEKSTHKLWYRQPAEEWKSSLPVGNGRMGGLIKGTPQKENILINEESLWAGEPAEAYPENFSEHLKKVQQLVLEDKLVEANNFGVENLTARPTSFRSYEPFAHLLIEMDHSSDISNYHSELDMHEGIVRVQYEVNGVKMLREAFVSAADDVMVVRISSDSPGAISGKVQLTREKDIQVKADSSGNIHLDGQIIDPENPEENDDPNPGGSGPGGKHMKFAGRLHSRMQNGQVEPDGYALRVREADEVILLFTAATDYNLEKLNFDRSIDPAAQAEAILAKVNDKSWETILQDHIEEHRSYFDRVSIDLGDSPLKDLSTDEKLQKLKEGATDPELDADFFQYARYLILSSSRPPGRLPANLQGIWNFWMWAPWEADFHLNINLQMNYWVSHVGNIPETLDPFFGWFSKVTERGRQTAENLYHANGWLTYHATNPFGRVTPSGSTKDSQFQNGVLDPLAGAWMAVTLWRHYEYTDDKEFLREKAYPILKGASEFLTDVMIEDDEGQLLIVPSASPENSFIDPDSSEALRITKGSTYHNAVVREIFEAVIKASTELGVDTDHRQELIKKLEKVPGYQIGGDGTIQEWIKDYKENSPGHRHISHLLGFHPFAQITPDNTPQLFEAVRKTIERRVEHGWGEWGWSNAWKTNCYARLKNEEKAYESFQNQLSGNCSATLFESGDYFQIESRFGSAAGIAEMILQSHRSSENNLTILEILPALPETWKDGKIKGFLARGGFEVDISWKNSQLENITLHHSKGNNCLIKYGEKTIEQRVDPGEPLKLDRDLIKI